MNQELYQREKKTIKNVRWRIRSGQPGENEMRMEFHEKLLENMKADPEYFQCKWDDRDGVEWLFRLFAKVVRDG